MAGGSSKSGTDGTIVQARTPWGAKAENDRYASRMRAHLAGLTSSGGEGGTGTATALAIAGWSDRLEAETAHALVHAQHLAALPPPDEDPRSTMRLWAPIADALVAQRERVQAVVYRVEDLIEASKAVRFVEPA